MPALAIPVETKSEFVMPADHLSELSKDLGAVDTVVAIGWRGSEAHFQKLLGEKLPRERRDLSLVVVAESRTAAEATAGSLVQHAQFTRLAVYDLGFSRFVEESALRTHPTPYPCLSEVLEDRVQWSAANA